MNPNPHEPRSSRALAVLILVFVVLSWLYNLYIPAFEGPDERHHGLYIDVVAGEKRLPRTTRLADGTLRTETWEIWQPPLYYLTAAGFRLALGGGDLDVPKLRANPGFAFTQGTPQQNLYLHEEISPRAVARVHAVRTLSTLFGVLTLLAIYGAGLELFQGRTLPALLSAGIAATIPQFLMLSSLLSNDSPATAWAALITLLALRHVRSPPEARHGAALGCVTGLGLLTKTSVLPLVIPGLGILVWHSLRRNRGGITAPLAYLGALAIVTGGWYVRNILLWGDPLAQSLTRELGRALVVDVPLLSGFWFTPYFLTATFTSFWGVFGSLAVFLPKWGYMAYGLVTAVAVVGLFFFWRRRPESRRQLTYLLLFLPPVAAAYISHNTNYAAAQGRLLFAALPALALLLGAGLSTWIESLTRVLARFSSRLGSHRDRAAATATCMTVVVLLTMNVAWLRGPIRRAYGLRAENYLPTTMAPLEGDLIRDLCCGKTLRQSFVAAPGLTRVDLVLRPTPRDHAHLGFTPRPATLVQVQQATEVLREVPLAPLSLAFKGHQRVEFEPIESSGTFNLILTAGPAQWGIGVGVSQSGAYPRGELFENDERVDGDLLFGLFYDD